MVDGLRGRKAGGREGGRRNGGGEGAAVLPSCPPTPPARPPTCHHACPALKPAHHTYLVLPRLPACLAPSPLTTGTHFFGLGRMYSPDPFSVNGCSPLPCLTQPICMNYLPCWFGPVFTYTRPPAFVNNTECSSPPLPAFPPGRRRPSGRVAAGGAAGGGGGGRRLGGAHGRRHGGGG